MVEIGGEDKLFGQSYNPVVFIIPALVVLTMFGKLVIFIAVCSYNNLLEDIFYDCYVQTLLYTCKATDWV